MAAILRFRKLCFLEPSPYDNKTRVEKERQISDPLKSDQRICENSNSEILEENPKKNQQKKRALRKWSCIDSCCWMIGCLCTVWWLLLFLHHCMPANLAALHGGESPGARMRRHGAAAKHPVVLVPGIVTGALELWEGRPCSDGLFRQRLWAGSFAEIFKRFDFFIIAHIAFFYIFLVFFFIIIF